MCDACGQVLVTSAWAIIQASEAVSPCPYAYTKMHITCDGTSEFFEASIELGAFDGIVGALITWQGMPATRRCTSPTSTLRRTRG